MSYRMGIGYKKKEEKKGMHQKGGRIGGSTYGIRMAVTNPPRPGGVEFGVRADWGCMITNEEKESVRYSWDGT